MQFVIIVVVVMNISIRNNNTAIARTTAITSVIFIISTIILIIITVVFVISTAINAAARDQIMYSGDKALSPRSGKKLLRSLGVADRGFALLAGLPRGSRICTGPRFGVLGLKAPRP